MLKSIGDFIRDRRKELGLSQAEVAAAVGVSVPTVSRWERGDIANMARDKIAKLAKVLRISPLQIVGFAPMKEPGKKVVPLLGRIACGEPILAEQNVEEYISLPSGVRADYALTCRGQSMTGAGIQDGDVVFIREQPIVDNGQIAAVREGDKATLKRFKRTDNGIILMPENPDCDPIIYNEDGCQDVEIMGLAVAFLHKLV